MRTALLLMLLSGAVSAYAQVPSFDRDGDPVVLTGADLGTLLGLPADRIVAFRAENGWLQIPVQVDQRKVVDFGEVYGSEQVGIATLVYADPTTHTGPDADPTFDQDDELVFMAGDAGVRAVEFDPLPSGVLAGSGVEVEVFDPLAGIVGFAYLFAGDGSISPDAGEDYIIYTFHLPAGDYLTSYNVDSGPNPEETDAVSAFYRTHFSDRWIRDELNIFAGDSAGTDILDRHTSLFAPGVCSRSEDTFSIGPGAFIANKDGPVRAIRSSLGANSGPYTQREHIFYGRRQDITTFLRAHAIPGVMDLYDYSPAATGMYYHNDLNLEGVLVDGSGDFVSPGPISWEMVTGIQGTMIIAHLIETDINPFVYTSFYSDDAAPETAPCTGDVFEYATSGVWVNTALPNTDPRGGEFNTFTTRRIVYYDTPGATVEKAAGRWEQARHPLQVVLRRYAPYRGDYNDDCHIDLTDYVEFGSCHFGPDYCAPDMCALFDWDNDRDVTLDDFGGFQNAFTGRKDILPECEP